VSRKERPGPLARLDGRAVPMLARALRRVGRGGRRLGGATGPPGRLVARLVRREPTVAAAVIAVLVAVVLIVATGGDGQHSVAPSAPRPTASLPGDQLGPAAGQQVSAYLAVARQRRALLAGEATTHPVTAVVDFIGYLTPPAVTNVLQRVDGLTVSRAFVRAAPPADADVHTISLSAGSDLAADIGAQQADARSVLRNYHKLVAYAHKHPSGRTRSLVKAYAEQGRQAQVDATGIGPSAGCVFALVVSGPPAQLERLAVDPEVRVLDPDPADVPVNQLMIVPLEPQVSTAVEPLTFAGG
jgi:hypothetical protein